jgi:hypothetical protein
MLKLVFQNKSGRVTNKRHSAFLFAILLCWSADASAGQLCLSDPKTNIEIVRYTTGPDQTFSLSFIHSVSLTPVVDEYVLRSEMIIQTREIFEAHGAGLPSFDNDVGATGWQFEDGKFILEMVRPFDQMRIRIQHEYKNALHIAGQDIDLSQFDSSVLMLRACSS